MRISYIDAIFIYRDLANPSDGLCFVYTEEDLVEISTRPQTLTKELEINGFAWDVFSL